MKTVSMIKGLQLCLRYQKMSMDDRDVVRQERLSALVKWAREKSPVYAARYRDVGDVFSLTDLPPVSKAELMAQFDDWLTDPQVKLTDVEAFMEDQDNIGRLLMGKHMVFTTSGSTGSPLIALCDQSSNNIMGAINILRSFTHKSDLKAFMWRGGKSMGVFATNGFYLSNSSVRARVLAMPRKKKKFGVTSALLPVEQIVSDLNRFQPVMLGGYPSNLELLVDEQTSGRLHIKPTLIMTGGEYLSDDVREKLSRAFGCTVQTSYSCTEAGSIACECTAHHFHINDDWVIVEPVDSNNRPVADGVQSDKILITNLYNYTQPFIRYEVTDRVVMHHERCSCGNPSPWLTLEGRTDDVVQFTENGQTRKIAPLPIYATLKAVHALRRFQVIVHPTSRIDLRLETVDGISREDGFTQARIALTAFLAAQGVETVDIRLSDERPKQQAGSGKFKHIVRL